MPAAEEQGCLSKTLANLSLLLADVIEMLSSVCVFIEVSHKSFALILSLESHGHWKIVIVIKTTVSHSLTPTGL